VTLSGGGGGYDGGGGGDSSDETGGTTGKANMKTRMLRHTQGHVFSFQSVIPLHS
jgi:hypothetical protein